MKEEAFWVFITVIAMMMIAMFLLQIRNVQVYRFRMAVFSRLGDYTGSSEFCPMLDEFLAVSQRRQIYCFWKPLASFWPADSRLHAAGVIK